MDWNISQLLIICPLVFIGGLVDAIGKLICAELGKPESLIHFVTDRKGHDLRYAIDPTKIYLRLGWLPETRFADGIRKTIAWYLENESWWRPLLSRQG